MLKKSITYTDFNGKEVTEDHYFHLSKADIIELEMQHKDGLYNHLQKITDTEDKQEAFKLLTYFILTSYGKRSEDGSRFIKDPMTKFEFQSSEAYSQMLFELCTDDKKATEFIEAIIPKGLEEEIAKIRAEQNGPGPEAPVASRNVFENKPRTHPSDFAATPTDAKLLTVQEIAEMDAEELKNGLATGKYKLSA